MASGSFIIALVAGIICGVLGAAVPLWSLIRVSRGRKASIILGLLAMMASFAIMMLTSILASVFMIDTFVIFGCAMVASFLLLMMIGVLVTWRAVTADPHMESERAR